MAADHMTKAERLYNQCLKAYEECRKGTGSTCNGMPDPGMFNDEYNIPAELLFEELRKNNNKWDKERHIFGWRLLEWVYAKREWDLNSFAEMRKKPLPQNVYTVYLELFYQCEDYRRRPFIKPIVIDGVQIEWCSKREYVAKYNEYSQKEQNRRDSSESTYLGRVPDYKDARCFPKIQPFAEKYVHPLKITVKSTSGYSATISAIEKAELVLNCLNVAQGAQKLSMRLFGGSENKLGSKTVFVTTGHYIVCNKNELETFTSDDRITNIPKNKYEPSKQKNQFFQRILKSITHDSVVRDRIECVLRDLALAYDSTNAGLKTLSYWRCLEHATRSNSKNRQEKEIIGIFKYQFRNEHWKQMGDLVLNARNKYVHSGLSSGKEEYIDQYVNWAQKYAEQALYLLLRLYNNRKYWESEEDLDIFFDNYTKDAKFFEITNIIRNARKNKK